jgi:SprT-like protein
MIKLMTFTERQLNIIAKDMAQRNFGMDLNIPININGRKNGNGLGVFWYNKTLKRSIKIDMSKRMVMHYKPEAVLDTLLHEITHWSCFERGEKHSDGDNFFESELRRVGASSTGTKTHAGEIFKMHCADCGSDRGHVTSIRKLQKYLRGYSKGTKYIRYYKTSCCNAAYKHKDFDIVEDTYVANAKMSAEYERALALISGKVAATETPQQPVVTKTAQVADVQAPETKPVSTGIIIPGRRGVTNAQMIPAIEKAVMENNKEDLLQLQNDYPTVFQSSQKYIKKSLQFRFNQLIS